MDSNQCRSRTKRARRSTRPLVWLAPMPPSPGSRSAPPATASWMNRLVGAPPAGMRTAWIAGGCTSAAPVVRRTAASLGSAFGSSPTATSRTDGDCRHKRQSSVDHRRQQWLAGEGRPQPDDTRSNAGPHVKQASGGSRPTSPRSPFGRAYGSSGARVIAPGGGNKRSWDSSRGGTVRRARFVDAH